MGCVYKACDGDGRIVAVKMMSNRVTCYPEYRQLFNTEVETMRRLDHPSVVHITGEPWQDEQGNLYIPMEFIEGETLESYVKKHGAMQLDEAARLMVEILEAMQYVHEQGRIHRDIKPSNIMLRPDGSICIIDFGIAKDARIGSSGRTVGRIIGTDGYMSPEQATGLNIDKRTDIYSLGCVLYFMLTARNAIDKGSNDYATVCSITGYNPLPPSHVVQGAPRELDNVFIRAVDKDMRRRWQTVAEFKNAILEATGSTTPKVTVGRDSDNDIIISDPDVSRHHLTIKGLVQKGRAIIEMTDTSTNGTGLDGRLFRRETTTIDYDGTMNLPEVMLAGKPQFTLDWLKVVRLLKTKGWSPVKATITDTHVQDTTDEMSDEILGWGLKACSFLFPIVGWVLWGVFRRKQPDKASTAARLAWAGFITSFVFNLIMTLL